ncbi:MAG TPA: fusaric acid resistance protein, partial [Pseudomonas sp.]|nr:fusaric acid resistance protein [Pseudomonas sp.]
ALVIAEVGAHYAACLRAGERLHAPPALLRNMERARLALSLDEPCERLDARPHLLHALAGLRLALLPGVEVMLESAEQLQLPSGLDGAPL